MGDNYFLLTNLLSEDERKVITSITAHIERGEKRVGIQQIAAENYLSTASIVKMCKRLGFDGYSELYYHLSRQFAASEKPTEETLRSLIDNYSGDLISGFCTLLHERRRGKIFTTGEGSIWEETNVIGVTAPIYNDTISVSKNSEIMDADLIAALQDAFINIGNTEEGKQVIAIYSHNGYQKAQASDYDNERAAQKLIQELTAAG